LPFFEWPLSGSSDVVADLQEHSKQAIKIVLKLNTLARMNYLGKVSVIEITKIFIQQRQSSIVAISANIAYFLRGKYCFVAFWRIGDANTFECFLKTIRNHMFAG
jgi:hypothetical protein